MKVTEVTLSTTNFLKS